MSTAPLDASPQRMSPGPWLHSRSFDLALVLGVLALALLLGGIASRSRALFAAVLLADFWLLAYPHVASTFTRIAFDRASVRRHWFLLFGLPPLVLAGTAGLTWAGGVLALNTLYFTWQSWHYSRQSYGIARAYSRRAGAPFGRDRLSDLIIYAFPLWGLLYRSSQGNHEFYGMALHFPQVPKAVPVLVGAVAFSALALWGLRGSRAMARGLAARGKSPARSRLPSSPLSTPPKLAVQPSTAAFRRSQEGQRSRRESTRDFRHRLLGLSAGHTLFVLSHVAITFVSYVAVEDITRGWLFINIWHNAQYLLFVWAANARRFRGGVEPERRFLSRLCQPDQVLAYALVCLGVGALLYSTLGALVDRSAWNVLPLVLVVHMTVNFHHYLIDAVIWRSPARRRP